jgi:hypothetical protein
MADVEVYGKMLSTLPDDDDHPYRYTYAATNEPEKTTRTS